MARRQTFEIANDGLPSSVAAKVRNVTEEDSTRPPRMERDVIGIARGYGRATFLFLAALFGAFIFTLSLLDVPAGDLVSFAGIALCMSFAAGSAVYLITLSRQLEWYKEHTTRRRKYGLAIDEPPRKLYERSATEPNVRKASQYTGWTESRKRQVAARLVNDGGDWTGGDRFTRSAIEGIVPNYTENWPLIAADFAAWGWVYNAGTDAAPVWMWTAPGRHQIKGWR